MNNKQPALQLYGKNKDKLDVTFETIEQLLPKLSELKGLIQISNVWFVSKKFGITIKLLQGMVYPKETLSGFSLLDDSDDEGSDDEAEESDELTDTDVDFDSDAADSAINQSISDLSIASQLSSTIPRFSDLDVDPVSGLNALTLQGIDARESAGRWVAMPDRATRPVRRPRRGA